MDYKTTRLGKIMRHYTSLSVNDDNFFVWMFAKTKVDNNEYIVSPFNLFAEKGEAEKLITFENMFMGSEYWKYQILGDQDVGIRIIDISIGDKLLQEYENLKKLGLTNAEIFANLDQLYTDITTRNTEL